MQGFAHQVVNSDLVSQLLAMQLQIESKQGRSLRDDLFVAIQLDTRFGCMLTESFKSKDAFRNPCHGQAWDSTGRLRGGDFTYGWFDLRVPPYWLDGDQLVLGELAPGSTYPHYDFSPDFENDLLSPLQQLIVASQWGRIEVMKKLLKKGVNANGINNGQASDTPLMAAVGKRQLAATRLLLEHGANPNPNVRTSPLEIATIQKSQDLADLLLKFGATKK